MEKQERREIDKKLSEGNPPDLRSILGDVHCLQEMRTSNQLLMNFLKSETIFRQLIGAILFPTKETFESTRAKDKYRFVHQCCEALCMGAKQFYPLLVKHEDLLRKMTTYLGDNSSRLDPVLVGVYSRLVLKFLMTESDKFLAVLVNSNFLSDCLDCLENGALFELICEIANSAPNPGYRRRVKAWFLEKGLARKMVELLSPRHSPAIHENVAQLWIEFAGTAPAFSDPLIESLQSEETIDALLKLMFPADGIPFSPSIVASIGSILNALLERDQVQEAPSQLLLVAQEKEREALDLPRATIPSPARRIPTINPEMGPERAVETKCAEHAPDILKCLIESFSRRNSTEEEGEEESCGDVILQCMRLLVNLTNTNILPTHLALLRAFSTPEMYFAKLFERVKAEPSHTIFNVQLEAVVLHILHSKQRPLIDFLIKDFHLPFLILNSLAELTTTTDQKATSIGLSKRLSGIAKRAFFSHLGKGLIHSMGTSPNAEYVEELVEELHKNESGQFFVQRCCRAGSSEGKSCQFREKGL